MKYTTSWHTLMQTLMSFPNILFGSFRSMMLKTIKLLTLAPIIRWDISTAIWFFLISSVHQVKFWHNRQVSINTRFHTSFSIIIDSVIPNQTGKFAKPVSFFYLIWPLIPEFVFFVMAMVLEISQWIHAIVLVFYVRVSWGLVLLRE